MSDLLYQDPNTGQIYARMPGNEIVPISAEEARIAQEGGLEAIDRTVRNRLAQGAVAIPSLLGHEGSQEAFGELTREQELRSGFSPTASAIGTAGSIGAEVGSAAVSMGAGPVAMGTARAAARGARMGMDAAEGAVNRVRGRIPDRSIGAAEAPEQLLEGGTSHLLTSEQLAARGFNPSRAQAEFLDATASRNMDRLRRAEAGLANEDFIKKSSFGPGVAVDDLFGFLKNDDIDDWFTKEISGAMGRHDLQRIMPDDIWAMRDEIKPVFRELLDDPARAARVNFPSGNTSVSVVGKAQEVLDNWGEGTAPASLKRLVRKVEGAAAQGRPGRFEMGQLMEARHEADEAAKQAFKAGKHDTGQSLTTVIDYIDEAIESGLTGEEKARLQLARRRWKIKKVLERTAGTMSKTNPGQVNTVQFANNYRHMTPSYRDHVRVRDDFEKMMDTAVSLSVDRAHAGNTLYRAIGPATTGGLLAGGAFGF